MSAGEYVGEMAELDQAEPHTLPLPATVPVSVSGPVQVQHLPSRSWAATNKTVAAADGGVRIANADPRRRHITLLSSAGAFYLGQNQAAVQQQVGGYWPVAVPCSMTHQDEIWVAAEADTVITVMEELWAD